MNGTEEAKKRQQEEIATEITDIQRLLSKVLIEVIEKQYSITERQMAVLKTIAKSPIKQEDKLPNYIEKN